VFELILRFCEPWLEKHWRVVAGFFLGGIAAIAICDPMHDDSLKAAVGTALVFGGLIIGLFCDRRSAN
jgi:hypothetical protein